MATRITRKITYKNHVVSNKLSIKRNKNIIDKQNVLTSLHVLDVKLDGIYIYISSIIVSKAEMMKMSKRSTTR
jgi:hypothetical protein